MIGNDDDCLHCVIGNAIGDFLDAHGDEDDRDDNTRRWVRTNAILNALVSVVADFVANIDERDQSRVVDGLRQVIDERLVRLNREDAKEAADAENRPPPGVMLS